MLIRILHIPLRSPHIQETHLQVCKHLAVTYFFKLNFLFHIGIQLLKGFPGGSDGKESTCNAGDLSSIPGLERSPGEGNAFLPGEFHGQDSGRGCKESDTTGQLSTHNS